MNQIERNGRIAPEHLSAIDQQALAHLAAKRHSEMDAARQALGHERDPRAGEAPSDTTQETPTAPAPQIREDEPLPEDQLPGGLRKRFVHTAGKYYPIENPSEAAFEDRGPTVVTKTDDPSVAQAMMELADAKGWRAIKVTGSEEFRREVWFAASLRGIEVAGFKPRDADLARLKAATAVRSEDGGQTSTPIETNQQASANEVKGERMSREGDRQDRGDGDKSTKPEPTLSAAQRIAVKALAAIMRERGDSAKAIAMATSMIAERFHSARTYVGELVAHGTAPYDNDRANEPSYYVKLRTEQGEKIVWGVDLQRAVAEGELAEGDKVVITYEGRKAVQVPITERDETGRVIGQSTITTHRNQWAAHDLNSLGQAVRRQVEVAARASAREPVIKVHDSDALRPSHEASAPVVSVQREQTRARA